MLFITSIMPHTRQITRHRVALRAYSAPRLIAQTGSVANTNIAGLSEISGRISKGFPRGIPFSFGNHRKKNPDGTGDEIPAEIPSGVPKKNPQRNLRRNLQENPWRTGFRIFRGIF